MMKGESVEVALRKAEPILRRILNTVRNKSTSIVLLLTTPEEINQESLDSLIGDRFSVIAEELSLDEDWKQHLSITAAAINSEADEISKDVKTRIIEILTSSGKGLDKASISDKLHASWQAVSRAPPTPILTKVKNNSIMLLSLNLEHMLLFKT